MRRKLTATICALTVLGTTGLALAAPIPIAVFSFSNSGDLSSFFKIAGDKCSKKLRPQMAMGINVGAGTSECVLRDSVVSSSDDPAPNQDIQATVTYDPKTPSKLQKKLFLAVVVRASNSGASGTPSGYELRIVPNTRRWVLIRRGGSGPSAVLRSGNGTFIKTQPNKLNILRLRVFGSGSGSTATASLIAQVNGQSVFAGADPTPGPPAGRFNGVAVGNKANRPGAGMLGSFDDVTIRIPNPR